MSDARLLAARGPKQEDPISRFLLDSEHFFFSPIYRGMVELTMAARNDDDLAEHLDPIVQRARITLNTTWREALTDAGFARKNAELFVELTHYLLRGLFLVSTWLPYKPNRRALIEAWSQLAPGILRVGESPGGNAAPRRPSARRKKKA
jgi:hypothetical protein